MKRWVLIAAVAITTGILWQGISQGESITSAKNTPPASSTVTVVGVDEFMKKVDHYRGQVWVKGVVSGVSPQQKLFTLIDVSEFKECKVTSCARLTLPVRWADTMPAEQTTVLVAGQVQKSEGKLIFVANTLKKVEAQPAGAK